MERPAESRGVAAIQLLCVREAGAPGRPTVASASCEWRTAVRRAAHGVGIPIPDEQIQAVQTLLEEQLPFCSHPFLKIGQRVRIRSGAFSGVEGILVSRSGERTLVISLDAIQRSLSVRIEGYDVEPV